MKIIDGRRVKCYYLVAKTKFWDRMKLKTSVKAKSQSKKFVSHYANVGKSIHSRLMELCCRRERGDWIYCRF